MCRRKNEIPLTWHILPFPIISLYLFIDLFVILENIEWIFEHLLILEIFDNSLSIYPNKYFGVSLIVSILFETLQYE